MPAPAHIMRTWRPLPSAEDSELSRWAEVNARQPHTVTKMKIITRQGPLNPSLVTHWAERIHRSAGGKCEKWNYTTMPPPQEVVTFHFPLGHAETSVDCLWKSQINKNKLWKCPPTFRKHPSVLRSWGVQKCPYRWRLAFCFVFLLATDWQAGNLFHDLMRTWTSIITGCTKKS